MQNTVTNYINNDDVNPMLTLAYQRIHGVLRF